MAYVVVVTSTNSSGKRTANELNRLRVAGGFRNAVAESVGMYQKMVNQGSNSDEVNVRIFDHDTEEIVAMSVSTPDAYQIQSTLEVESDHYIQSFPLIDFFTLGKPLVFKNLEPKVW